jgi:pimeloyl-ACP methyl ester carboxylesterase
VTRAGQVIYLHGFSSSPASSKAQRFARELAACGVPFTCPDLNQPAFEMLTVSRMLGDVRDAIAGAARPVAIVGSSLGAFVAVHAAQGSSVIDRLILLAPALEFGGNRLRRLGDHGIEEWRRLGRISVFHHADNRPRDIGFALYEDAASYDAFALPSGVPTLIFQGRQDDTVDPASVERWARARSGVDLRMVDDDHQLAASMDRIWEACRPFLGLD